MKKLKLNLATMQGTEVLSRDQLKKIVGGASSGSKEYCVTPGTSCGPLTPTGESYVCSIEGDSCCCGHSDYNAECVFIL